LPATGRSTADQELALVETDLAGGEALLLSRLAMRAALPW
jgi:hypothetical protein